MTAMSENIYFVSGIDTDAGKSYATGYIARMWNGQGRRTITQKFVQTGNRDISEDIETHRRIMGCGMTEADRLRLTMPEIYTYPCSPHLAAEIDGRPIDFGKIERAAATLAGTYDAVLVEGAGGLMVPLTRRLLTIDYVADKGWPLIFVTSGKLGSISHTLLALEAVRSRGMRLYMLAYNLFPEDSDSVIGRDTEAYLRDYAAQQFPSARFVTVPKM